jgi:CheY-like chemotaxis protein
MAVNTFSRDASSIMNPHAPALPLGPLGHDIVVQLGSGLFSGISVIDEKRSVLGIVKQVDYPQLQGTPMVCAEDVMTVSSTYLQDHMTLEEIGSILLQEQVMQLPVVREGQLVGVITRWMVFGQDGLIHDQVVDAVEQHSDEKHSLTRRGSIRSSSQKIPLVSGRRTLLVADDDPVLSGLLCDLLKDMGYRIMTAGNGQEALHLIRNHRVDGLLLDLEMPVMDGVTMLDELRWENEALPVVVMSGGVDQFTLQNLLHEGAQGYLMKPCTVKCLHDQCERVFGPAAVSPSFLYGADHQSHSRRTVRERVPVGAP